MTDPNKAAVAESNAQLIARMPTFQNVSIHPDERVALTISDFMRLRALAEERVMIEEHGICVYSKEINDADEDWMVATDGFQAFSTDLSTALRSVVAKIGEGK